jgi:ABC-2 type transport system ATP-binding protein/lipopolysaccharide transport system ATP-binding protein
VEREGRTVVFVSHDLDTLSNLCTRSLWLEAGRIRDSGVTADVVREYLAAHSAAMGNGVATVSAGPVTLRCVRVLPLDGGSGTALFRDEAFAVEIEFGLAETTLGFDIAVYLTNSHGTRVLDEAWSDRERPRLPPGSYRVRLEVPPVLNVGDYTVGVWFGTAYQEILEVPACFSFRLEGSDRGRPGRVLVLQLPLSVESLGV